MSTTFSCSTSRPHSTGLSTCDAIDWLWRQRHSGILLVGTVVVTVVVLGLVMILLRCVEKRRHSLRRSDRLQQGRRKRTREVQTETGEQLQRQNSHRYVARGAPYFGGDRPSHVVNVADGEDGNGSDVTYCMRLKNNMLVVVGRVSRTSELGMASKLRPYVAVGEGSKFVVVETVATYDNDNVSVDY